jgi:hypothetical protein
VTVSDNSSSDYINGKIRELYARGDMTAAAIGQRVGLTKNCVIGRIRRMRLSRPVPVNLVPAVKAVGQRVRPAPDFDMSRRVPALYELLNLAPPEGEAMTFMSLAVGPSRTCCWPAWRNREKPTHEFCGAPAVLGRSYCLDHIKAADYVRRPQAEGAVAYPD